MRKVTRNCDDSRTVIRISSRLAPLTSDSTLRLPRCVRRLRSACGLYHGPITKIAAHQRVSVVLHHRMAAVHATNYPNSQSRCLPSLSNNSSSSRCSSSSRRNRHDHSDRRREPVLPMRASCRSPLAATTTNFSPTAPIECSILRSLCEKRT